MRQSSHRLNSRPALFAAAIALAPAAGCASVYDDTTPYERAEAIVDGVGEVLAVILIGAGQVFYELAESGFSSDSLE